MSHPNRARQVEQIAERLTLALLPPTKRKAGEQPDYRLRQLEKDIQRERIKVGLHLAEVLCGRLDRGEDVETVTAFARAIETELRAYSGHGPTPDVAALTVEMAKEVGDACGAAIEYASRRNESSRRVLVKEVSEARDVLDQIAVAATGARVGCAA